MSRGSRTVSLIAAVTTLSLAAVAGAAQATGPRHDWRGEVVRSEPQSAELRLPGAGDAWNVWYRSTSWNGKRIVVSGTVTLPPGRAPRGGWPVVSYALGFNGVADQCAISRVGQTPTDRQALIKILAAGYAIVVTDLEGVGTPGPSPVLNGRSEAQTMIDVVRAARHLGPVSARWASAGRSQGGHAALFASARAAAYGDGLHHVGTIALAPLTQLGMRLSLPGMSDPAAPADLFLPFEGLGFELTAGRTFKPADYFTPRGLELIELARTGCLTEVATALNGLSNGDVLLDTPAAVARIKKEYVTEEIPVSGHRAPVLLGHGLADRAIPATFTEATTKQFQAAGVHVRTTLVPDADHFTIATSVDQVAWLGELFHRP